MPKFINFFPIFSVLDLEKFIFGFVSSKFLSLSFNDSDALRALNIFRHAFIAFNTPNLCNCF